MKRLELDKSILNSEGTEDFDKLDSATQRSELAKLRRALRAVAQEEELSATFKTILERVDATSKRFDEQEKVTLALAKALKIAVENRVPRTAEEAMRKVHRSGYGPR